MIIRKRWIATATIFILFIVCGFTCKYYTNSPNEEKVEIKKGGSATSININGYIIKEKPLSNDFVALGTLVSDEEVNLSFETSGKIVSINFEEGTYVNKGDLLAKVNDKTLQAQLSRYKAQLKLAEARVYRQTILLEQDAVSLEALEEANTQLAILNADIELVKANISLTELRAPFDGIIGLRQVSEGSYASPNTIIATLSKTSPIKVEFSVNEIDVPHVKNGTKLTFRIQGDLKDYKAQVYAAESSVDRDIRTLKVRALYPNTNRELTPGRYVNVSVTRQEIPDAIVIPSQALIKEMGMDKIFLYKDGKAEPAEVKIGMRTNAQVQIIHGINVGDTIITSGTLQLRSGMSVVLDNVE